jgi:colanic acid biosynthesis protein WcaH
LQEHFLEDTIFKTIIENTPLVSVDIIVKKDNKILLGKRINKPAYGYWFTLGGRVLKNEMIQDAIKRIYKIELGSEISSVPKFIGIFEHFYTDSIYDNISTHYINLGYEVEVSELQSLPSDQHNDYKWFSINELMQSNEVHNYVKDYFTKELGSIPQK